MKQEWYSYKEVAEWLNVSVQTLRNWKMQGKIKPKKFGGRVLFHISYLMELAKNGVSSK